MRNVDTDACLAIKFCEGSQDSSVLHVIIFIALPHIRKFGHVGFSLKLYNMLFCNKTEIYDISLSIA